MAEIACPRCNPESKAYIRRLNKTSICLICMNTGWTRYDKKCSICGADSGIDLTCSSCIEKLDTGNIELKKVYLIKDEIQRR